MTQEHEFVAAVNACYTLFELFNYDQSYCDDLKGASLLLCEKFCYVGVLLKTPKSLS